jgi:hypothetical protein
MEFAADVGGREEIRTPDPLLAKHGIYVGLLFNNV